MLVEYGPLYEAAEAAFSEVYGRDLAADMWGPAAMSRRWVRNHLHRLPAGCALWREIELSGRYAMTLETLGLQKLTGVAIQQRNVAVAGIPWKGKPPQFDEPTTEWSWQKPPDSGTQGMDGLELARQLAAIAG